MYKDFIETCKDLDIDTFEIEKTQQWVQSLKEKPCFEHYVEEFKN